MEEKVFGIGDRVCLESSSREWEGVVLESYDPEIVLLKLDSGYNIGIREREIKKARLVRKAALGKREEKKLERKEGLRNISMIITGGTISSRLDPKTGAVTPSKASDLVEIAPGLCDVCNILRMKRPITKLSEDIGPKDWKLIARSVLEELNDSEVDGVIVTHGTDTISYTASALSFFIRDLNKPVAMTYAQRSIDRPSTDASLNLLCAARYAVSDIAEVALIGHEDKNDKFCLAMPATRTRKMHSSARDAFKIINSSPIARISREHLEILRDFRARAFDGKAKLDAKFSNKVGLLKFHPGQDSKVLDFYRKNGYEGLVIEVTGLGHLPTSWIGAVKKLVDSGVVVCAAAQTFYGRLNPNVYSKGRRLQKTGIIFLEDMFSESAFVKLSWVLGHRSWKNKVKEKMLSD